MRNNKTPWYMTLNEVVPFKPDLEVGFDILGSHLTGTRTVQSCKEVLIFSVLANSTVQQTIVMLIRESIDGMKQVAKGCLVDDRVQNNHHWKKYALDFTKRLIGNPALSDAYPFLRAIAFASMFERLRQNIFTDLGYCRPSNQSEQKRMYDVGNIGGTEYQIAIEDRRRQLATQDNELCYAYDSRRMWLDRVKNATTPEQLIHHLVSMSKAHIPVPSMQNRAIEFLNFINGDFLHAFEA